MLDGEDVDDGGADEQGIRKIDDVDDEDDDTFDEEDLDTIAYSEHSDEGRHIVDGDDEDDTFDDEDLDTIGYSEHSLARDEDAYDTVGYSDSDGNETGPTQPLRHLLEREYLVEPKYMVNEAKLIDLIGRTRCKQCRSDIDTNTIRKKGRQLAAVKFVFTCINGHSDKWISTNYYGAKSLAGIFMHLLVLLGGLTWDSFATGARFIGLAVGTHRSFSRSQNLFRPAINTFFEKHMTSVRNQFAYQDTVVAMDSRYDSPGFCATKATTVFIEYNSGLIIDMETIDSREVARQSSRMERYGTEKGLIRLDNNNIHVVEAVSDASSSIANLLADYSCKRADGSEGKVFHSKDVWHKAKHLREHLATAAKPAACKDLRPWIRSVVNHFWWVCSNCNQDEDHLLSKWTGMLSHVTNKHDWVVDYCRHGHNVEPPTGAQWLHRDSRSYGALRSVVTNRDWLGGLASYVRSRHTSKIENFFSHALLRYCPKRLSFPIDNYRMRNQLAVLDYNHHVDRPVQRRASDGAVCVKAQVSRRTKEWVAYAQMSAKTYTYITDLAVSCLLHTYGRNSITNQRSQLSTQLNAEAPNLSGEKRPLSAEDMYASHKRRSDTGTNQINILHVHPSRYPFLDHYLPLSIVHCTYAHMVNLG